jgi:glucose dehydrogenase
VFVPVNDGRLVAVNADTGKACSDFGQNGEVNLQEFMPYAYPGGYNPTSVLCYWYNCGHCRFSTDNYSIKSHQV